jgi:hypothetical protein
MKDGLSVSANDAGKVARRLSKIKSLPPEMISEVEDFVGSFVSATGVAGL